MNPPNTLIVTQKDGMPAVSLLNAGKSSSQVDYFANKSNDHLFMLCRLWTCLHPGKALSFADLRHLCARHPETAKHDINLMDEYHGLKVLLGALPADDSVTREKYKTIISYLESWFFTPVPTKDAVIALVLNWFGELQMTMEGKEPSSAYEAEDPMSLFVGHVLQMQNCVRGMTEFVSKVSDNLLHDVNQDEIGDWFVHKTALHIRNALRAHVLVGNGRLRADEIVELAVNPEKREQVRNQLASKQEQSGDAQNYAIMAEALLGWFDFLDGLPEKTVLTIGDSVGNFLNVAMASGKDIEGPGIEPILKSA